MSMQTLSCVIPSFHHREVSSTATKTDAPVTVGENDGEPPAKKTKKEGEIQSQLVERVSFPAPINSNY